MRLFRVALPVPDIERAVAFYEAVLDLEADHSAPGRPYFHCGGTILAIVDPGAHGRDFAPNPDLIYLAVADLEAAWERARAAGAGPFASDDIAEGIGVQPWGERSFYCRDPFGSPLCFVDEATLFVGRGPEEVAS